MYIIICMCMYVHVYIYIYIYTHSAGKWVKLLLALPSSAPLFSEPVAPPRCGLGGFRVLGFGA